MPDTHQYLGYSAQCTVAARLDGSTPVSCPETDFLGVGKSMDGAIYKPKEDSV